MELRSIKQITEFVLTTCSNMEYDYKRDMKELIIFDNFDLEKVFYVDSLLQKKFHFGIRKLWIKDDECYELPEGYLEDMKIQDLWLWNAYRCKVKLPKLPITLCDLYYPNPKNGNRERYALHKEFDRTITSYPVGGPAEGITKFVPGKPDIELTKHLGSKHEILFETTDRRECLDFLQNYINNM